MVFSDAGINLQWLTSLSSVTMRSSLDFVTEKIQLDSIIDSSINGKIEQARQIAIKQIEISLTVDEFVFVLNQFLTVFNDAHTSVINNIDHLILPITFVWLADGLIVSQDGEKLHRGDRILRIGFSDQSEIDRQLQFVTPAENSYLAHGIAPQVVVREDFLRRIGAVHEGNLVPLQVQRGTSTVEMNLTLQTVPPISAPSNWYAFKIDAKNSLALITIDRCEYSDDFATSLESFMRALQQQEVKKLVIDLRRNHGGDALVAFAVANYISSDYTSFAVLIRKSADLLKQSPEFCQVFVEQFRVAASHDLYYLPSDLIKKTSLMRLGTYAEIDPKLKCGCRVFLLTSNYTFSSANLFATLFKDNFLATLVGDPTGNEVNFHGQMLNLDMPGLPLTLTISTTRNTRPDSTKKNTSALFPNVPASFTAIDVLRGGDPQLELISRLCA
jgi:hypothetical protein